ncbi:uncharacterized protein JCM6883_003071, partial [Sporobolomyces salmoneus]|uniref:uncharacterized protein n=1 Tax=Sporobolomyces salmoneus TaxID=183962 RepID=UPI0031738BA6
DSTEEEKKIKGYQRKPLISTVLDWKFAQESTRSNIPESFSLLDGSYARVVRNFGSNRYLSTIWFANESNVGVVRAMTHSSTQGMKALFDFAIVKGYVIHVDGLFTENGFGQGGVPLAVESEEALYRKLGLTFIPSSSRRLNLGEDFLDWSTEGEKATTEKGKGKGKGKERGEGEGVVQNQGLATGKGMGKGKGKKKQLSDVEDEDEEPKKKKGRAKKDSGSGSGVKKRSVEEEEVVSVALTTKRQKTNAAKKGEK